MAINKPSERQLELLKRIQSDGGRVSWFSYGDEFHPFTWTNLKAQGWIGREISRPTNESVIHGAAFLTDKAIAYLRDVDVTR